MRRPELVVAAAVLISLPMVPSFLDGGLSPTTALVRFLIALAVCWAGGAVLTSVVTRYANAARRDEITRSLEEARSTPPPMAEHRFGDQPAGPHQGGSAG